MGLGGNKSIVSIVYDGSNIFVSVRCQHMIKTQYFQWCLPKIWSNKREVTYMSPEREFKGHYKVRGDYLHQKGLKYYG